MAVNEVVLRADQALHVGAGKGSGFSATSLSYVPASMFRGATAARWWREHPDGIQQEFDDLIGSVSFADAVVAGVTGPDGPTLPLDRLVCKYPQDACPREGHPFGTTRCPTCGRKPGRAKGKRALPPGAAVLPATRVALDDTERARDDHLYRREALDIGDNPLTARVDGPADSLAQLGLTAGSVLRFGGSLSVAGRVHIETVSPAPAPPLTITAATRLRVELQTPGVYVDDFGFPVPRPSAGMLRHSLRLGADTDCAVERGFTRWAVVSGWHAMANRPKSEDLAVIPHSVFHVAVSPPPGATVTIPSVVSNLGLRRHEGCGWATVTTMEADDA